MHVWRGWRWLVAVCLMGAVAAGVTVLALGRHAPATSSARAAGAGLIPAPGDSGSSTSPSADSPRGSASPRATTSPGRGGAPTAGPSATALPGGTPGPSGGPAPSLPAGPGPYVTTCGLQFCGGGAQLFLDGASVYNPGLRPEQSGYLNPAGTVSLAREAHLNLLRIVNFYSSDSADPNVEPFREDNWVLADRMIAAAGAAGMHVDLSLGDYRNILWESCIDPYTYDWTRFLDFVANRRNTVTGVLYKDDPTIAFVSIAGEPLQANRPHTGVNATGSPDSHLDNCTIEYSTQQLTDFYSRALDAWAATGPSVMINTGGIGYIDESNSGIDWHTIMALPHNGFCDIKTYGGMQAFAPTVANYCHAIGKPLFDEEFGWEQGIGDSQRAANFTNMYRMLRNIGAAGFAFWNLGYQVASYGYDVSTSTPITFAAVQAAGS